LRAGRKQLNGHNKSKEEKNRYKVGHKTSPRCCLEWIHL
jgi:hypothetical protein